MRPLIPKTSLAVILAFCLLASNHTQAASETTSEAAIQVITEYRTVDPSSRVQAWKQVITHPSGNPKFSEFQSERLRQWQKTEFAPYQLEDPEIIALVTEVIRPVLELYRRQNCFKILVVNHHVPVAMNDSGVLLMVTTGLIERATSDDEILGHVAHELGHDLFWQRTDKARRALELYKNSMNTELLARQAKEELAKIELECDAFSAITLAALGRNPVFFGQYLLSVERTSLTTFQWAFRQLPYECR
ncbi:MAG: hypothetical protein QOJ02_3209 [Acidobacteriota bacterium]|jgi:predicted Zn-dependent protease|nr:hypothetical protein [Acidobacteriota bacterium]